MSEKTSEYHGPFAIQLQAFIDEKKKLGCRYAEEERLARKFDEMSMYHDCNSGLSPELVCDFIKYQPNWQATTQKRRISFLRNFGSYLVNHDIQAFLPGYDALRATAINFKPYILSHEEITGLFRLSGQIRPNYRQSHIFYPVLFRVLYGTGMRISEALHLTMADVGLGQKVIRVVDPKNHKDRHLPISSSLAEYCSWYSRKIHPVYHEDDLFFLSNKGDGHYSRNNIQVYFNSLICRMGIPYNGYKGGGPHLHCLRHTFCVHSLEKMLRENVPHGTALQLLSAYMGHRSLSATSRYLQLTAEAFPDLMEKIETIYGDIFPKFEPAEEIKMPYEDD